MGVWRLQGDMWEPHWIAPGPRRFFAVLFVGGMGRGRDDKDWPVCTLAVCCHTADWRNSEAGEVIRQLALHVQAAYHWLLLLTVGFGGRRCRCRCGGYLIVSGINRARLVNPSLHKGDKLPLLSSFMHVNVKTCALHSFYIVF